MSSFQNFSVQYGLYQRTTQEAEHGASASRWSQNRICFLPHFFSVLRDDEISRESGQLSELMSATKYRTLRRLIAGSLPPPDLSARLFWENVRMAFLIEHKAQVLYITASSIMENGKKRKIVIESRPEYAVITLQGSKEQYPISWENLFRTALRQHENNLRIEAAADKKHNATKKRPSR